MREFISAITQSKLKLIVIVILLAAVPLTVFIAQQRQETRQRASAVTYAFNSSSTINTPDQNNLTFWARKKTDGSYIPMDNTWWTGNKYAYIDTDDGDRGYFHNAPQASPNPTPATPVSTSYTLPNQFSNTTQGERWEYYYLEAGSISTSALTPGTGRSSTWFGDGWTVAGGGSWALIKKHEIGGGQPDKLRIIPGDNQKVYVYWKAPGPGQATINVRSTKTDSQGGGYKLGIAYTPDLANRVVANNIPLQDPFVVWGNQINEEKPLSGSHQMNGNDALVFYVDPDNGVVIQGGQTDTFAFGDVSSNTISVEFTPTPPTAAPTTAPATNPTIDGMDANFKIAPGYLAPGVGYNAVARWTAPQAGSITITGSFTRCCIQTDPLQADKNTRTIYSINKILKTNPTQPVIPPVWTRTVDNTAIQTWTTNPNNRIEPYPFTSATADVEQGDMIEFWVDSGEDGSGWDNSSLNFTISYVEPTAVPTTATATPTEIPTPTTSVTDTPTPTASTPSCPTPSPVSCASCGPNPVYPDANKDCIVNASDWTLVNSCITNSSPPDCANADVNRDNVIDVTDAQCIQLITNQACGNTTPANTTPAQAAITADADGDGCVSIFDFAAIIWALQHNGVPKESTHRPNVNGDQNVDTLDYSLWYSAFQSGQDLCP